MKDRKRMKKVREKRIESLGKQVEKHKDKIENEETSDVTKKYWEKEIDEKFLKQIEEDEDYMEEKHGRSNKKDN